MIDATGGVKMKNRVAREAIALLVDQEILQKSAFLSDGRLVYLAEKLRADESLSMRDADELARYVVGNYIGEDGGHECEDLIDWLMDKRNYS